MVCMIKNNSLHSFQLVIKQKKSRGQVVPNSLIVVSDSDLTIEDILILLGTLALMPTGCKLVGSISSLRPPLLRKSSLRDQV